MAQIQIARNPFALMMDPASVIAAVEHSDRLSHLNRRICRPLDRPVLPRIDKAAAAADAAVDAEADIEEEGGEPDVLS